MDRLTGLSHPAGDNARVKLPALLTALFSSAALAAPPLPDVNAEAGAGLADYWRAEGHKAFVISPSGVWGWQGEEESSDLALETALKACQARSAQRCVPYAEDARVVFDAKRWPTLWRPYATAAEAARAPQGNARGQRFPDLYLTRPDGRPMALSHLRGKVVVLHFWGTWCPACRQELPQFPRLLAQVGKEAAFLFVQVREPAESARQWLKRQGLALPVHDSGAKSPGDAGFWLATGTRISDREVAPVFPSTYVLDRHGVVVFSLRGSAPDWMAYAPFLKDLVAQSRAISTATHKSTLP